jgi:hypothetical protein
MAEPYQSNESLTLKYQSQDCQAIAITITDRKQLTYSKIGTLPYKVLKGTQYSRPRLCRVGKHKGANRSMMLTVTGNDHQWVVVFCIHVYCIQTHWYFAYDKLCTKICVQVGKISTLKLHIVEQ